MEALVTSQEEETMTQYDIWVLILLWDLYFLTTIPVILLPEAYARWIDWKRHKIHFEHSGKKFSIRSDTHIKRYDFKKY